MDEIDKDFMQFLCGMGKVFGTHDLMLKVFAILYIEPEEISMDDIAKKTGYSLASISNTMKMLEAVGGIERIHKPGSKKVYFYMQKNLMIWNINKLEFLITSMVKPAKDVLPGIIEKYKDKLKTEKDIKKLYVIEQYLDQIKMFEKIIVKWKKDLNEISKKIR